MARPTDALRADYYGWAEGVQAEIDALARRRGAAMSDEVTIDVGPVFCPSCKREFGNTERDRLASLVERCPEYMRHHLTCASIAEGIPHCSCGLLDLLTEMENQ